MEAHVRQLLVDPRSTPWGLGIDFMKTREKGVLEVVSGCCKRVLHYIPGDQWVCSSCNLLQERVKYGKDTQTSILTVWDSREGFSSAYYARQWVAAWLGLRSWNVEIKFELRELAA